MQPAPSCKLYELEAKELRYPPASPTAIRRAGPEAKPMAGRHSLDVDLLQISWSRLRLKSYLINDFSRYSF